MFSLSKYNKIVIISLIFPPILLLSTYPFLNNLLLLFIILMIWGVSNGLTNMFKTKNKILNILKNTVDFCFIIFISLSSVFGIKQLLISNKYQHLLNAFKNNINDVLFMYLTLSSIIFLMLLIFTKFSKVLKN